VCLVELVRAEALQSRLVAAGAGGHQVDAGEEERLVQARRSCRSPSLHYFLLSHRGDAYLVNSPKSDGASRCVPTANSSVTEGRGRETETDLYLSLLEKSLSRFVRIHDNAISVIVDVLNETSSSL
jgi:hypothetical protein